MADVIIRDMRLSDAQDRGYVHYKSWQETYTGLINREYLEKMSVEKCVNIAKQYLENTLVAEVDGKIAGFLCYGKYRGSDIENCAEINAVYVLKIYQKMGIGKMLMDAGIEKLFGYKKAALWVLDSNKNAVDFYKKYGFEFDKGKAEAVLITPITELRMIKDI